MLNPKCQGCGMAMLITQTFCSVARLEPEDYYFSCFASQEKECLGDEEMNLPEEKKSIVIHVWEDKEWEELYIDGKCVLHGHHLTGEDVAEAIAFMLKIPYETIHHEEEGDF